MGGVLVPVHQEEWSQAIGMFPWDKKDGWGEWARVGRTAEATEAIWRSQAEDEQTRLVRMMAGIVLTGNSDTHRRNIGIQHIPGQEGRIIVMAPQYDCSSIDGVERSGFKRMELPIGVR